MFSLYYHIHHEKMAATEVRGCDKVCQILQIGDVTFFISDKQIFDLYMVLGKFLEPEAKVQDVGELGEEKRSI